MKQLKKMTFQFLAVMVMSLTFVNPVIYAKESNVLSVVTGDWNQDKHIDAAVLMKHNERVEIYIFLANKKNKLQQVLYKQDIVWMGSMGGAIPYLESRKNNTLFIFSGNDSIGRHRWSQILTIAYRDKSFMIGGYTYESRDTLDPENFSSCDVNLFTGKGFNNGTAFKIKAQKIKLKNWTDESIPEECERE